MEVRDNFSSTEETVKLSKRPQNAKGHGQTKTEIFPRSRRSLFRKKKLRRSANPTDSTSTLVEHVSISQSLNNHNLKISLKDIYENDPVAQLKEIFNKTRPVKVPKSHSREIMKNYSFDLHSRKRGKVDSIFQHNEADFIINELRTIKSPEVWNQVVENFKKKPSILMDLIPLEPVTKSYCRTPNLIVNSPNRISMLRKTETPSRPCRRNLSSTTAKVTFYQKSPRITRPGSITPIEATTFLQENDEERLTEDWSKSLLYKKISDGTNVQLSMTEQDLKVLSRKPPRDPQNIKLAMDKGLTLLRILLMELLGTKEDMQRFEERFKGNSPHHVRALMERCLNLMKVRILTLEILTRVHKRECIMKNLKFSKNKIKEKILKVFCLNKEIREKISDWAEDESVPFDTFTFKNKDYLNTISEESIVLQEYMEKVSNISNPKPIKIKTS